MPLPKPKHDREGCDSIATWIAVGGPCPACKQRWVRFPDFEELLHLDSCTYIASADYHAVVDEAVQVVMDTVEASQ